LTIGSALLICGAGTNPEVFVLLEAHAVEAGSKVWKYALVQMTGGAVSVSVDNRTRAVPDPLQNTGKESDT
jgi:hypothetical protein